MIIGVAKSPRSAVVKLETPGELIVHTKCKGRSVSELEYSQRTNPLLLSLLFCSGLQ